MPDDLAHVIDLAPHRFALLGNTSVRLAANSNPSVRELLSRNTALAKRNSQLTEALAAAEVAPVERTLQMAHLTPRQREVMDLVLAGHPSKNIAADLQISQRTVENHRAAIMRRTGASSLPALVRLSLGVA
jgi:two-component system, chemotaxis family, CheB/CheR fusion protein